MRRASPLVLAFTALALLAAPRAGADEPPLAIRVVTFNAWGVPVGSDHKEARLARIGAALAALQPDVVALQELWSKDDLDLVQRDLAAGGLRHAERFPSRFGSGLLVASRWQLSTAQFQRFALGGKPHAVWHADWWGGKGAARVRVNTPYGAVLLVDTHLHARYGSLEYLPTQLSQALELAAVAGEPVANEWAAALRSDAKSFEARLPLILAGDLNSGAGDLPFELLRARAGLQPAAPDLAPDQAIDWVLLRSGTVLGLRVKKVTRALTEPVDLGEGVTGPLSDHPAVVVDLELRRLTAPPRVDRAAMARADWEALAPEVRTVLEDELALTGERVVTARVAAAFLLLLAVGAGALARWRRGKRGSCLTVLLTVLLLHLATWGLYFGVIYEPGYRDGLAAALAALPQ